MITRYLNEIEDEKILAEIIGGVTSRATPPRREVGIIVDDGAPI